MKKQNTDKLSVTNAIVVIYNYNQDGARMRIFSSYAAMFEHFTPEELGTTLRKLWAHKLKYGESLITKKSIIIRGGIIHKSKK